jgi:hypothetical protein
MSNLKVVDLQNGRTIIGNPIRALGEIKEPWYWDHDGSYYERGSLNEVAR